MQNKKGARVVVSTIFCLTCIITKQMTAMMWRKASLKDQIKLLVKQQTKTANQIHEMVKTLRRREEPQTIIPYEEPEQRSTQRNLDKNQTDNEARRLIAIWEQRDKEHQQLIKKYQYQHRQKQRHQLIRQLQSLKKQSLPDVYTRRKKQRKEQEQRLKNHRKQWQEQKQ